MSNTKIVEFALKYYPDTRDSDRKLMVKVWEIQQGKQMNPKLEQFLLHEAASPETIRRTRQKFQEHGKYKASPKVEEKRFEKFKEVREAAPHVTDPVQLGLV